MPGPEVVPGKGSSCAELAGFSQAEPSMVPAWPSVPVADTWAFWGSLMVSVAAFEAGVLVNLGLLMG